MKIEPGTKWRHYKGGVYEVISLARLEASEIMTDYDGDLLVVYQPLGNPDMRFARPIAEWLANPPGEKETLTQRMRFVPVIA